MKTIFKQALFGCALTILSSLSEAKDFFTKGKSGFDRMNSATSMALWKKGDSPDTIEPIHNSTVP